MPKKKQQPQTVLKRADFGCVPCRAGPWIKGHVGPALRLGLCNEPCSVVGWRPAQPFYLRVVPGQKPVPTGDLKSTSRMVNFTPHRWSTLKYGAGHRNVERADNQKCVRAFTCTVLTSDASWAHFLLLFSHPKLPFSWSVLCMAFFSLEEIIVL